MGNKDEGSSDSDVIVYVRHMACGGGGAFAAANRQTPPKSQDIRTKEASANVQLGRPRVPAEGWW